MDSLWLPLSLLCAFSLATSDALAKRALASHNEYLILWLRLLFSLPLLAGVLYGHRLPGTLLMVAGVALSATGR